MWFTLHPPKSLLHQHDLHAALPVALTDLALTIVGITTRQGVELNPLFKPFTDSLTAMLLVGGMYVVILCLGSLVLAGELRKMLGSFVFGMHMVGTMSWLPLIAPRIFPQFNLFHFMVVGTAATAMFAFAVEITGGRGREARRGSSDLSCTGTRADAKRRGDWYLDGES